MSNWMHRVLADAAGVSGREVIPRIITVANPVAGADWSQTVTSSSIWFVQSVRAQLNTAAAVATRAPALRLTNGEITIWEVLGGSTVAATGVGRYNYTCGLGYSTNDGNSGIHVGAMPEMPILGGWSLQSSTTSIQAADQWSGIQIYVLELEETPYEVELQRDLANLAGNRVDAIPQLYPR